MAPLWPELSPYRNAVLPSAMVQYVDWVCPAGPARSPTKRILAACDVVTTYPLPAPLARVTGPGRLLGPMRVFEKHFAAWKRWRNILWLLSSWLFEPGRLPSPAAIPRDSDLKEITIQRMFWYANMVLHGLLRPVYLTITWSQWFQLYIVADRPRAIFYPTTCVIVVIRESWFEGPIAAPIYFTGPFARQAVEPRPSPV